MKDYSKRIGKYLDVIESNVPIEVACVRDEVFSDMPETAYYKAIERFTKNGVLIRLTKGVYYKPKRSRFGIIPISDDEIAAYYMRDNKGIVIGERLYNEKGITTQVGKKIEVLSDLLSGDIRNAKNVTIRRTYVDLTPKTIPAVETLEILQNYRNIEDADNRRLISYMNEFASHYSDKAMNEVLMKRKYKKSTIAFLRNFLDYFGVENTMSDNLSEISKYDVPTVEELYETA